MKSKVVRKNPLHMIILICHSQIHDFVVKVTSLSKHQTNWNNQPERTRAQAANTEKVLHEAVYKSCFATESLNAKV